LATSGGITVDAGLVADGFGRKDYAKARAHGGSGGTISAGVFLATAKVAGAVTGLLDGDVLASGGVSVVADGAMTAIADTEFVGIGVASLSGSGAEATISSGADITATVSALSQIASTGQVSLTATGGNTATANSDGGTGGLVAVGVNLPSATIYGATRATLAAPVSSSTGVTVQATGSMAGGGSISVAVVKPSATVRGDVLASFNADMPDVATDAASLTVRARGRNVATTDANIFSIGLLASLGGGIATSLVTSEADVQALVTSTSQIATSGVITVDSALVADGFGRKNYAKARAHGGSGGSITGGDFQATAKIGGVVTASFAGDATSSGGVDVTAGGGNTVLADTEFVGIGLVGLSGSGAEAAVQLGADVTASTDVGTTIASTGVVSVSATGGNTATANSDGGTG